MCLIALNKNSSELDVEALIRGHHSNADAFGILGQHRETGEAIVSKAVGYKPHLLRKEVERIAALSDTIAVHLRLQTHGMNDLRNCHPYKVQFKDNRRYFIMHNGIFSSFGTKKDSDTMDFIRQVMMPILKSPSSLYRPHIQTLLDTYCETNHSKLVIFDEHKGLWQVFNEEAGTEEGDIWYSNTGYKSYVYPSCRGYSGNYQSTYANRKLLTYDGARADYYGDEWGDDAYWEEFSRKTEEKDFQAALDREVDTQDWVKGKHHINGKN